MHVAAPILDGTQIIGVVTVAKPNRTVQPYIDRTKHRLAWFGGMIILGGIVAGALLAMWLSSSIRQFTVYAKAVSEGQRVDVPISPSGELTQLANALESMRVQLEGKAYVERYVQTLTHELKSPLAAIHGAAELLRQDMSAEQRQKFIDNIDTETHRLQQLTERLLNLAMIEQRQHLDEVSEIKVKELIETVIGSFSSRIRSRKLSVEVATDEMLSIKGERFLLQQALSNLIDNAIDFTPDSGWIKVSAISDDVHLYIRVWNQGESIPDFALPRLTERFYSLPRPITGRKSTGLGLNFVKEVAELHHGSLTVGNVDEGVEARIKIPV
jgi:two-component system sensor histidine kinase CreC